MKFLEKQPGSVSTDQNHLTLVIEVLLHGSVDITLSVDMSTLSVDIMWVIELENTAFHLK